jgi:hypothetical protein
MPTVLSWTQPDPTSSSRPWSSGDRVAANLRRLAELKPGDKLGQAGGDGLFTVDRAGKTQGLRRLLTAGIQNDEEYLDNLRGLFQEALRLIQEGGLKFSEISQARAGLANLQATYKGDAAKEAKARQIIDRVAAILRPLDDDIYLNPAAAEKHDYAPNGNFWVWQHAMGRSEGWKLHVSAHPETATQVAQCVLPVLSRLKAWHKFARPETLKSMEADATQRGKFITVYPSSRAELFQVVSAVDRALAAWRYPLPASRRSLGPKVQTEVSLGSAGLITARYGGFEEDGVLSERDYERYASEGRTRRYRYRATEMDERGRVHPPWIEPLDLARDSTDRTPFPEYRRVGLLG